MSTPPISLPFLSVYKMRYNMQNSRNGLPSIPLLPKVLLALMLVWPLMSFLTLTTTPPTSVGSTISPTAVLAAAQATLPLDWQQKGIQQFLDLTPRKLREMTGKHLTFKEVVALKTAQHKVKKALSPKSSKGIDWKALTAVISGGLGCLIAPAGLLIGCPWLGCGGALLGAAGVTFGILGLKGRNRGLALAGLIAGGLAILVGGGIFALGFLGG